MKTNSLLALASFAVFAASASAAQSQPDSDVVVLPTYVVTSPRSLAVEQQISTSLNELRLKAKAPTVFISELPMLRIQFAQQGIPSSAAKSARVAKS